MEGISEDIYLSIDGVTTLVEEALDAVSLITATNPELAIELCHKAFGILSTILQFNYFKVNPHQVLWTCLEALDTAAINLQDRLHKKGDTAPPVSPPRREDTTLKSNVVTGIHNREKKVISLCDIIGNDAAKVSGVSSFLRPQIDG